MGTGSFTGVKRLEPGVDHSPSSSAEVKERIVLYLYSPYGSSWPVIGWTLPILFHVEIWPVIISGRVSYADFLVTSCFANVKAHYMPDSQMRIPQRSDWSSLSLSSRMPIWLVPEEVICFIFNIHQSFSACTRKLIREQVCEIRSLQSKCVS